VRGNLTRRGKSSWRLKYDLDPDGSGRQTRYATLKGTRVQAEAEAAKIIASIGTAEHVDASGESVTAFTERWLRDWADSNVGHKTWTRYEQLLRKHLCRHRGSVAIQKLRAADLQAVYSAMAREGLADRTRLHLHRVVHTMLRHAAQCGVVAKNIASMVDAPRVAAREIEILSGSQLRTVLEAISGRPLHPIGAVALGTGLRRSELLALRWKDVTLTAGVLRVERALEQTQRGGLVFKEPKTKYGRRTVTLPVSTIAALRAHWTAQQQQRLILGLGKAPEDALAFSELDGAIRSPNALTKEWQLAMRQIGLKGVTLHSLRHTHASALIHAGLDVLTISRRLGHGSPAITLGIYGHLFKTDDRAAAIIEAAITGAAE
jgi:integrase